MVPATFNIFRNYGSQVKLDGADGKFAKPLNMAANSECVMVTAAGKVLARGGGLGSAPETLKAGLKKWEELPEAERQPGAVTIEPMKERPGAAPQLPPPNGLVLAVHTRNLKRDGKGELALITREDLKDKTAYPNWDIAYAEATRDNLWLTEAEWQSLLPAVPRKGDTFPVPPGIRDRILLHHLNDSTQGSLEHPWERKHLKKGDLTLTVEETTPAVRLRLDGAVSFASTGKAERGYEGTFQGYLDYDPAKKTVQRCSFLALGDTWGGGSGDGQRFVRPGRTPLAVAFDWIPVSRPIDRIAPVAHSLTAAAGYTGPYFNAAK